MDDVLERNRNLNRGFRKLDVWKQAVELYVLAAERHGKTWMEKK
jgi:hypothetical protein